MVPPRTGGNTMKHLPYIAIALQILTLGVLAINVWHHW